ncbi:MAG TPA: GGDEF domain-containing protein [Syntrophales bacterium]|nr:GGDEF domain-containing protein [Syntrophales bacterium]
MEDLLKDLLLGEVPRRVFKRDDSGRFEGYQEEFLAELAGMRGDVASRIAAWSPAARDPWEELRRLACFDPRTGLPNQILFFDRLEVSLARARRERERLAVLAVDARIGPDDEVGEDSLFCQAARRLSRTLRRAETLATPGDGLFLVVITGIVGRKDAVTVTERILAALEEPLPDGRRPCPEAAVGVALFPDHGEDARSLVENAGEALRRLELRGGGGYLVYRKEKTPGSN